MGPMKFMLVIPILLLLAVFAKLDRHFFKENAYFCPNCIHPRWARCPQFETPDRNDILEILDVIPVWGISP